MLEDVNVALGITGSIAAVRTVEFVHELRRRGANVRAVMTPEAANIIHPWSVEFATETDVVTEITGAVEHVDLCGVEGWADVYLISPATANTVGKMASAVDDTPVTTCATTALGSGLPVVVVPAMHKPMYDHPGVLEAIEQLESWDVDFVEPRIEEGKAKIASDEAIVTGVARAVDDRPLGGQHVVVTAGATAESIDPVRVLTNRASGATGRAVARACYVRGADVTLVHGALDSGSAGLIAGADQDVPYATVETVESAAEMLAAVEDAVGDADALVSAAAISDYTVETADEKIRSGRESLTLELEATPKLLDTVREVHPELPMVGFKAETTGDDDAMIERARELRDRVGLAFVVANDASVMGDAETRALLVDDNVDEVRGEKSALGTAVADGLASRL
ncbi:MAG: bifunctional phosphopantothenoylcysteine decarboxylase/phosphopantothenate--cysteine ligase CoaBC [Halapricum sp.]